MKVFNCIKDTYESVVSLMNQNKQQISRIKNSGHGCSKLTTSLVNIGIKHGFPCINVCQVPREMLKTEAEGRGFQQLQRDLANVNVLEDNV